MPHAIPEPYVWDETFRVMYDNIDSEHKAIFNCIFDCAKDPNSAAFIKSLNSVTINHFSEEEKMMEKAQYVNIVEHKKIHKEFLAKIASLQAPLDSGTLSWAKQWLVDHIMEIDFKYKGKL